MWPFRRKKKAETEPPPAPRPRPQPPPQPAPEHGARTAEEILRELDQETEGPEEDTLPGPADPVLGRFLLAEGPLTREYIQSQVHVSGQADSYLGQLLAASRAPSEAALFQLLTARYEVPEVDLKRCKVPVSVARSVPREVAVKYRVLPVGRLGDLLCVAFAGEPNPKAIEAVRRATGLHVKAFRCPEHHIQILLRRLYAPAAARQGGSARRPAAKVAAVPISEEEARRLAEAPVTRAETRWESTYASAGPVRAVRFPRR